MQTQFYSDKPYICGVDEAGRGPLAGAVFAAACILPEGFFLDGLDDSKKISKKKREALFEKITEAAVTWAIASASVEEINRVNILNASFLAMRRALEQLSPQPALALVDGNIVRNFPVEAVPIVRGDSIVPCIAAASILAKVTRDRYCLELDQMYPEYGFARHKGYGTKIHMEMLRKFGPAPCHRKDFLKFLYR